VQKVTEEGRRKQRRKKEAERVYMGRRKHVGRRRQREHAGRNRGGKKKTGRAEGSREGRRKQCWQKVPGEQKEEGGQKKAQREKEGSQDRRKKQGKQKKAVRAEEGSMKSRKKQDKIERGRDGRRKQCGQKVLILESRRK
jgi:hypothetical protein